MIAAVFDARGTPAVRERLELLGKTAGFAIGQAVYRARSGVMSWEDVVPVEIDRDGFAVTVGTSFEVLDEPTLLAASELGGDFAKMIALESGLLLIRGRFGGRPIFFTRERAGECIVACSRLAPIIATRVPRATLDIESIATLLSSPTARRSRSTYREIERVDSGDAVELTAQTTRREPLARFVTEPIFAGTPLDASAILREHIDAAILRAVRHRKKIAVLVSGGVDSSALLASTIAIARGASRAEVTAITLHFAAFGDDRPHLRALTDALGIVPIRIAPEECTEAAIDRCILDGAPFVWPALGWLAKVARVARERGAELLLTGTGGDEMFGLGFGTFADRLRAGHAVRALRDALSFRAQFLPTHSEKLIELLVRPMLQRQLDRSTLLRRLRETVRRSPHHPAWYGDVLRSYALAEHDLDPLLPDAPTEAAALDALAHAPHLTDVAEMRAQLETHAECMRADPFLDDNLARFLATLPRAYFTHGNRHRGLFVAAMRGRVPESVRRRSDKGAFGTALDRVLEASGGAAQFDALLSMRALESLGLVRGAEFRRAFSDFLNDQAARDAGAAWLELWPPLVLEAFVRTLE